MKMGANDLKRLDDDGREIQAKPKRPRKRSEYLEAQRIKREKFRRLCERYGHKNPATIKARCRDEPSRHKHGMSLRQALRIPPMGTPEYAEWKAARHRESTRAWRRESLANRAGTALDKKAAEEAAEALKKMAEKSK